MARRHYNYHHYISDWMRKVEQGKIPSCNEQKQLMKFLRPILDSPDVEFREKHIEESVEMIHRHFPFKMHDYQLFEFACFYGLYEKGTEFPVFSERFDWWGRGTGKNGTASVDAFYLTSDYNGVKNYDVNIVATSEEQAMTSFVEVYNILESNPAQYKKLFDWNKTEIRYKKTNSKIKFLTANAKTKDGGRPGVVIFDEVHQYVDYSIINVLIGGLGKVDKPRIIYLTTDGFVRDSVMDDLKERTKRVLNGEEEHNGLFPMVFKMDNIREYGKPELFAKAIPRIEYNETLKRQVMKHYILSKSNPEVKEDFLTKRLNLAYVSADKTVATWEEITESMHSDWPNLESQACIGSVDYAELRDFCSVGLTFKKDGKHYFKEHTFIHEESLKMENYNINLNELVAEGFVTVVSGYPVIPPAMIANWFVKQAEKYYIQKVYADRFKFVALKDAFEEVGLELKGVPNGTYTHNQLAPVITGLFANRKVVFENNRLMRWYIWNVKVSTDKKGNKTYEKIEPLRRKTDGFFSFLHGLIATELNNEIQEATGEVMDFDVIQF